MSLSAAAVAECRLEPGGSASLFMWSKQCGHCGQGGRGIAVSGSIKQDFLKLGPVQRPQPEHTEQEGQSTAAADVCQLEGSSNICITNNNRSYFELKK